MFNTISSVDPGSRLEGRVLPGDELRYINRHEIRDVLDYKYWAYDRSLTLGRGHNPHPKKRRRGSRSEL